MVKHKFALFLPIAIFLILGLIYALIVPVWEQFDEPAHYSYIQYLADNKKLLPYNNFSDEIVKSMIFSPLSEHPAEVLKPLFQDSESFDFKSLDKNKAWDNFKKQKIPIYNWESQQPPFYYWINVPVHFLIKNFDIKTRIYILRIVNILVCSLMLFFISAILNFYFPKNNFFLIIFVLLPELYSNVARVGNEGLTALFYAILMYLFIKHIQSNKFILKQNILTGIILGIALITKASFFIVFVSLPLFFFFKWMLKKRLKLRLVEFFLVAGISFAMGGWWYIHNLLIGRTLSGLGGIGHYSLKQIYDGFLVIPWGRFFYEAFLNFWSTISWSFLRIQKEFYYVFLFISFVFLIGNIAYLVNTLHKSKKRRNFLTPQFSIFLYSLFIFFSLIFAMMFTNVQYYYSTGGNLLTLATAYYLLSATGPFAIIFFLGIDQFFKTIIKPNIRFWFCRLLIIFLFLANVAALGVVLKVYHQL